MTEETWTTVRIGGKATETVIAELKKLDHEFGDCQGAEIGQDGVLTISGMVNYGNPESLKQFCRTHDLTYRIHNAACPGVFDAGIEYWSPDKGEDGCDANDNGNPTISLPALKRAVADIPGIILADIIAQLGDFESIPPLEKITE